MTFDAIIIAMYDTILTILPIILNFFLVIILFLAGLLFSRLLKTVLEIILKAVNLDKGLKSIKFIPLLQKAEIKKPPSELLGDLVYWITIFTVIIGLAGASGMPVGMVLDQILSYMGIILLAALVLGLGVFFATIISGLVYVIASNIGISGAKTIARLIQYATIIFAFLLALEQLGIGPSLLIPSIGVIIGAVGLAAAIAFGLGCKDIMADFVSNLIKGK